MFLLQVLSANYYSKNKNHKSKVQRCNNNVIILNLHCLGNRNNNFE